MKKEDEILADDQTRVGKCKNIDHTDYNYHRQFKSCIDWKQVFGTEPDAESNTLESSYRWQSHYRKY